jgi:hypothetical protein
MYCGSVMYNDKAWNVVICSLNANIHVYVHEDSHEIYFFFFICFWRTSGSFFMIFSSVAPHRGQPPAKCHPRWQPIRRLAVSCGLGRHWIRTQDCRTTVWCATIEPPCLPPLSHHASLLSHHASLREAHEIYL